MQLTLSQEIKDYLLPLINMTLSDTPDTDLDELAKLLSGELEEVGLIEQDCQEMRIAILNYLRNFAKCKC